MKHVYNVKKNKEDTWLSLQFFIFINQTLDVKYMITINNGMTDISYEKFGFCI